MQETDGLGAMPFFTDRHLDTAGDFGALFIGEKGLDKSRYDNRADQWRKRSGSKGLRARRWASVPMRLILVTTAAAAAFVTQGAIQHRDGLPGFGASHWLGSRPEPITGVASVIDGDTIEIHGQRICVNGIDAPESRQYCNDARGFEYPCGRRSAEALDGFLTASRPLQCTFVTWDRYHRFVGDCRRADGAGVASWMVEHGYALDWPRYSHGAYAAEQARAQEMKVGLWTGSFQVPWEWRLAHQDNPVRPKQARGIVSRLIAQTSYSCEPRRTCSQISSCEEANWYLANCSWGGKLDRDKDGIPCESLC